MRPDQYVRIVTGTEFEGKQPYLCVEVYDPPSEAWHVVRATTDRPAADKVCEYVTSAIRHAQGAKR